MTNSPPRILKRFSEPLGYVPEEDTDVVDGGKAAKKFLNILLSKLRATVTILTAPECRHQMFFTGRKKWVVAEHTFEPGNGSLYVDAVLANIFLDNLLEFIGDDGHIKGILSQKEENMNILADHIATVLKPFLVAGILGDPARIRTIWAFYRPVCEVAMELQNLEHGIQERLRPAWDYITAPGHQKPAIIQLFDSGDFPWPSNFLKIPIPATAIEHSPLIPIHVKDFLSAFSSRLGQNFSIEMLDPGSRDEYDHSHREKIVMSVYNWSWIAASSLHLSLSNNIDDRRRELRLFESDLAVRMYRTLLNRIFLPASLVKNLEVAEKNTVKGIAEAVVRLLEKHRDFEFKFETEAWKSSEWKRLMKQFWRDREAEEGNNKKMKTETIINRISAGREIPDVIMESSQSSESMSENDDDLKENEPIKEDLCNLTTSEHQEQDEHEFDILTTEDSVECRLSITEIDGHDFRGLESQRLFINRILTALGAELVLKADAKNAFEADRITMEIRKDDDSMYQTELRTNIPERLLEQGIQSLVKSFEQRMLISSEEIKALLNGEEATEEMIVAIVEECDGSRM